jgi:hypothetical protein
MTKSYRRLGADGASYCTEGEASRQEPFKNSMVPLQTRNVAHFASTGAQNTESI